MRRLFTSRTVPVLASVMERQLRMKGSVHDMRKLTRNVSMLEHNLQSFEESKAANALVELYASRRRQELDIKRVLHIFSNHTYHAPIFCHKQLPIILAHYITLLDNLPNGLKAMPSILDVRETLLRSFKKLVECEIPVTAEQTAKFRLILEEIEEAHGERELVKTTAVGILELKEHLSRHRRALVELKKTSSRWSRILLNESDVLPYEDIADIQEPLDECNLCMIKYNFLSRMLLNTDTATTETRVGMVDLDINLERVVRNAVDEASQICTDHYGDCPETNFVLSTDSKSFRFPFMSTTVRYIVVELMKNAFRATVEAHMKRNSVGIVTCDDMPPVEILINLKENAQHACICISDEGLGMTQSALEKAMSYSYTSVSKPALMLNEEGKVTAIANPSPLAGYGYGLPMSRVYAKSFGGDLLLQTMEGYGTKAYYYIKLSS